MPKHKEKCLSCGKDFRTREEEYCLQCRLKKKDKVNRKEESHIHLVSKKINLKEEVKGLLFLENRYPEVVERIKSKKFNSKKKHNNSSEE